MPLALRDHRDPLEKRELQETTLLYLAQRVRLERMVRTVQIPLSLDLKVRSDLLVHLAMIVLYLARRGLRVRRVIQARRARKVLKVHPGRSPLN